MSKSICAVVVTYNRKRLLLNCLNALMQQTYPVSHIVVINNASKDGTAEFLSKHKWIQKKDFTLISLEENQGGAGGFYEGIKFAYEQGYDYIWLMDDDGYPAENCLEALYPYFSENCYIGPMVLDCQTQDKLSFSLRIPNSLKVIDYYSDLPETLKRQNRIEDIVLPFNGTLISADLVKKIGFPKKEYFIWGDEREYTMRAVKSEVKIATIVNALFYHPANSSNSKPMFFDKLRFNDADSDLKLYCFCRNSIDIFKQYKGWLYALAFGLKAIWFYMFTYPNTAKLKLACKAIWDGLKGDFSHHKDYLKWDA